MPDFTDIGFSQTCVTQTFYEHEVHGQTWVVLNETSTQQCYNTAVSYSMMLVTFILALGITAGVIKLLK